MKTEAKQFGLRKLVVRVTGGALALAAGIMFAECTNFNDGGSTAIAQAAATSSAALATPAESCPSPTPVPPQTDPDSGITCHPSACTPNLCARGDIAPLGMHPETVPLQARLLTLDCSPHSIPPLQIFAEADPVNEKSLS